MTARKPKKSKRRKPSDSSESNDLIKKLSKDIINKYLSALPSLGSTAKWRAFGRSIAEYYDIDLNGVSQPKHRDTTTNYGKPVIKVYDIDLKIRQFANKHAEHVHKVAKAKGLTEHLLSNDKDRFRGMLGGWVYSAYLYESYLPALATSTFGGSDDCDVSFKDMLFDVKSSYGDRLNINQRQFEKHHHKFAAYIYVKIPSDRSDDVSELVEKCGTAYVMGYATDSDISHVFECYDIDEGDDNYGVSPSYNKKTGKRDDYANPYCYINARKLRDIDMLDDEMNTKFFKGA